VLIILYCSKWFWIT